MTVPTPARQPRFVATAVAFTARVSVLAIATFSFYAAVSGWGPLSAPALGRCFGSLANPPITSVTAPDYLLLLLAWNARLLIGAAALAFPVSALVASPFKVGGPPDPPAGRTRPSEVLVVMVVLPLAAGWSLILFLTWAGC